MEKISKIKDTVSKLKFKKPSFKKITLKDLQKLNFNLFGIKYKFLFIVFAFCVLSTVVFTYSVHTHTQQAMTPIMYNHAKAVVYGAHDIVQAYHDKIRGPRSISEAEYEKMVRKLTDFKEYSEVTKIFSVMKYKDKLVYTTTSSEFVEDANSSEPKKLAKHSRYFDELEQYNQYFEELENPSPKLVTLINNDSDDLKFHFKEDVDIQGHTLYLPYKNRNGVKYIVAAEIDLHFMEDSVEHLDKMMVTIGVIFGIIMLSICLGLLTLYFNAFEELQDKTEIFFRYINKDIEKPEYVTKISVADNYRDELAKFAYMLNSNISMSVKNVEKDDAMLTDMQKVSNAISTGIFKHNIEAEANSPILKETRDMMNKMFEAIKVVVYEIANIAREYEQLNFKANIKTEPYQDTFLEMAEGINSLGLHFSKEVKESATSSMEIQNGSNNIREFIEEIKSLFETIIKQTNQLLEFSSESEKFNDKLQYKINETLEEKEYVLKVMKKLKNETNGDDIKDIELSLYKFMQNLNMMSGELDKQNIEIKNNRQPLNLLKNLVKQNQEMSQNIIKLAYDLSLISNKIRESVEKTDFEGKNEISSMMQNIDR